LIGIVRKIKAKLIWPSQKNIFEKAFLQKCTCDGNSDFVLVLRTTWPNVGQKMP
jgi:hypothetical protein